MKNEAAGVITNPISKESLKMAGINYPGHTEIFADRTGTRDFTMLFLLKNVGGACYYPLFPERSDKPDL